MGVFSALKYLMVKSIISEKIKIHVSFLDVPENFLKDAIELVINLDYVISEVEIRNKIEDDLKIFTFDVLINSGRSYESINFDIDYEIVCGIPISGLNSYLSGRKNKLPLFAQDPERSDNEKVTIVVDACVSSLFFIYDDLNRKLVVTEYKKRLDGLFDILKESLRVMLAEYGEHQKNLTA
ncbi:hypothetical protein J4230_00795 [Candidatus Woesearchaeota archaeon]|nr:hypothetical protein [Candidatus Woesearchaeota archaeon]